MAFWYLPGFYAGQRIDLLPALKGCNRFITMIWKDTFPVIFICFLVPRAFPVRYHYLPCIFFLNFTVAFQALSWYFPVWLRDLLLLGLFYKHLCHSFIHSLTNWSFFSKSSRHLHSLTVWARDLTIWENVPLPPCVTCHMSRVTSHMSQVTCHLSHATIIFFFFFSFKVVELIGGGYVINRAYPV